MYRTEILGYYATVSEQQHAETDTWSVVRSVF